jgi:hypothetical protein
MPYNPLKVNRYFGETFRLHLHNRRISQARNQREEDSKQGFAGFLIVLFFDLKDGSEMFLRNVG